MKLRRLELIRYGHLSDLALDFPDGARLSVVHGVNEAGKSTALAAIADALFGFGHLTDFDFLHGPRELRLGFSLASRDGAEARFVRRKGRGNTLRDAAGEPVPDDVLRPFLGNASRELFEQRFGLSAARMRAGAEELLRTGGALGESLFAGIGILNLRVALSQLDDMAKALVGDGRGQRALSEAVKSWRQARDEAEERAVAPRAWQAAQEAHDAARDKLAAVQEKIRALTRESGRLQRLRRVSPLLAELAAARDKGAGLADTPLLPLDAEARFAELVSSRRTAERDAERENAGKERLGRERAVLPDDQAALAVQDAIDALTGERSLIEQAINDLTKVAAEATRLRSAVAEAIDGLGLSLTPEAVREALPAPPARRAVQRLVSRHAALSAEQALAERTLAASLLRRDQARQALEATARPSSPDLLRRVIESVRSEGPLDTDLARSERAHSEAAHATATALAALPLWQGDLASLGSAPLPLAPDSDNAAARLDQAAKARERATANREALDQEIAALEDEMSRLSSGEPMPTPDAIKEARQDRDRVWRLVRRTLEGGPITSLEERADLPPDPLPELFEQRRDAADCLADRRADEAQRVSAFLATIARLALLTQRRQQARAFLGACETESQAAEGAWRALWAPAGIIPGAPSAMTEWRRARAEVLALAEAEATVRRQRNDLSARHDAALARLAALLPVPAAKETLAALLLRAETACASLEARQKEYEARKKTLADEEGRLPALQQAVQHAGAELAGWKQDWAPAIAALFLPEQAPIDTAESALQAWTRIAEAAPAWRSEEQRVADMRNSIAGFETRVSAVAASLADSHSDEPPLVTAGRLARRLAEARASAAQDTDLAKRIAAHEEAAADAARQLSAAEVELQSLRALAAAADDTALEQAISRARERTSTLQRIAELEEALFRQGDGLAEEALRAEAAANDPDAAAARLAEIETELSALGNERETLSSERTKEEALLASMQKGHDAAAKAQEAESALADACIAAERYARLHTARVLLRAGIERFRKEQQGPFLRSAGAHFALLTAGRYQRLIADHDAEGRTTLLAVTASGTECPIGGLSEGARDQLYLALRIAAVEAYAASAEPLPFIADDLLVQFDDARSAAAIELLVQLGKTTQVILFTHHDHIAALAAREPVTHVVTMPPPPSLTSLAIV